MRHLFIYCASAALVVLTSACSTTSVPVKQEVAAETQTFINEYPTRDRVEYVLNCIAQHGGLSYITQYGCSCKIDKIAERMSFADFDAAKTFSHLKNTPGEAGGVFRDSKQAKALRKRLKEAEEYAEKSCFVK